MKKHFFIFVGVSLMSLAAHAQSAAWRISQPEWSVQHESLFEQFVARIGEAVAQGQCTTVENCFSNPSINPYRSSDPRGLNLYADCADFPYFMRAYFAWKNELPFGFVSDIRPIQNAEQSLSDIRYSPYGNRVVNRYSAVTTRNFLFFNGYASGPRVLDELIPDNVSSGNFRMAYQGDDDDVLYSDFYPVRVTREAIRPGTVIYDPNGHVAMVYKVTATGRVYYADTHPDNTITTGLFNSKFTRSYPGQGAGFKNWRPLKLINATYSAHSGYVGGRIIGAKNHQLPLYSTEQFYGTDGNPDWKKGRFIINGQEYSFQDFVRIRLSGGSLAVNPLEDVQVITRDLCINVRDRVPSVVAGIQAGMDQKAHPMRLPRNIYGADGEWEIYATPSRDARLKVSFKELRDYVENVLKRHRARDPNIDYRGANLAADMLKMYQQEAQVQCVISYSNSRGGKVSLNLEQVRARVYDLSFDPYHCVERRWGASGDELQTCQEEGDKRAWYEQEKWLRFQHDRNTEAFTGYSLAELTGPLPGAGVASGQDNDVIKFLKQNQ